MLNALLPASTCSPRRLSTFCPPAELQRRMTDISREFRNALGCFATGVTVVTTRDEEDAPIGLTANSFSSVSLDPPMVLWCIDKASETYDAFMASPRFAINVLPVSELHVSQAMARPGDHRLAGVAQRPGEATGMPVLEEALASFECEVAHRYDGGDHTIIVGKVLGFDYAPEGEPLLYFRGAYAALAD